MGALTAGLRKEAGKEAVQASSQQTDVTADPPGTEESSTSKVVKCPQSDPSTPRPSGAQQNKKPTVPEQTTYAQVTSNLIRVANIPMAYPDRKLEDQEVVLLKRSIKGCILDLVKGTRAPVFQCTSDRDNAVTFNCVDKETVKWLKA